MIQISKEKLKEILIGCGITEGISESIIEELSKENKSEGWIYTHGYKPQISSDQKIKVMFKDGEIQQGYVDYWYECWKWSGIPSICDIIAYQLLKD